MVQLTGIRSKLRKLENEIEIKSVKKFPDQNPDSGISKNEK